MSKLEKDSGSLKGEGEPNLMYIGPTILHPVLLSSRSVYMGGIPVVARKLAEKDKDLAGCFVPLAEAGKALRELEGYPGTTPGEHTRRFLSVRKRYLEEVKQ
jgi:hypothetical protein